MNKQKIIKQIKKTIKELEKNPEEADTIKALEKQILSLSDCKYGEYTNEPVNTGDCKTCGKPTWVICRNKKVVADRVNSNYCKTCKHFENININNEV